MPADHDLKGLMKFLARDEWRGCFEEVFDDHFGQALEAGDMEFEDLAETLGDDLPWQKCETLDRATAAAFLDAKDAIQSRAADMPVVLLSPACASFDQFKSFEARGDAFRDLFNALANTAGQEKP